MMDSRLMKIMPQKRKTYILFFAHALLLSVFAILQALILAHLIDAVFFKHSLLTSQWPALVLLVMVFILRPAVQLSLDVQSKQLARHAKEVIRTHLTQQTKANFGTLLQTKSTGFLSFLGIDAVESTDAYYSEFLPHVFVVAITTPLILLTALTYDPLSALLMCLTAPLIPVFMILIGKNTEGVQQRQWLTLKTMNGHLLDVLRGVVTLRIFGRDTSQIDVVSSISESYRKQTMKVLAMTFISAFALELVATLSTAIIAVSLGVRLVYGQMLFLPALTVLLLAPEYYQPLRTLGLKYHAAMNGKTGANALYTDYLSPLDTLSHDTDHPVSQPLNVIEVTQLQFSYTQDAPSLFEPVTFTLEKGDALALTGVSGVGKTTLLKCLIGVLEPTGGCTNLRGLSPSKRALEIAYVPQKPILFRGTLLENLKFGNPTLSDQAVYQICRRTELDSIILSFPDGYQTLVGEGYRQLSGGETQLVALTRAWLRDTPFIFMDEPTSAMDVHTELALLESLTEMRKDKTLIIAAHRHKILELCNKTLTLKGGH